MNDIEKAIEVVKQGGIVIFPTDTAFGIGCRIDDEKGIKHLFELRKRPESQATPVLFDSIERVRDYVLPFDKEIETLMKKYWPGALTIVLPCRVDKVPGLVRGGGLNLGVRIPDHQSILKVIKGADVPILGPSANFHGETTPYAFGDLDGQLLKSVDFVLDGKTKGGNLASTVIDCSQKPWRILRQGAVNINL